MVKITLQGKQGKVLYLNPHQIEYVESDGPKSTVIVMLSGKRLNIAEDFKTLYSRIVAYRRQIGGFKNEE